MWPSEESASRLYDLANWGLIAGLVVGVVSTILLVWMGNIKEAYLRDHLAHTNERAASAGATAAKLEVELSKQREVTAKAQEMLLTVTKRQGARYIPRGALSSLLQGKALGEIKVLYQPDDTEAFQFALSLVSELGAGGWKVGVIEPIPADMSMLPLQYRDEHTAQIDRLFPIAIRAGGGEGLTLVARSLQEDQPADGLYSVLRTALTSLGFLNRGRRDETLPENSFVLIVGPKP